MRYRIEISEKALEQLRALPRDLRRNIGQRMEGLKENLQGDVVKLKAQDNRYRLLDLKWLCWRLKTSDLNNRADCADHSSQI